MPKKEATKVIKKVRGKSHGMKQIQEKGKKHRKETEIKTRRRQKIINKAKE